VKKSFSTGLVILLPLALSIWVFTYLFDLITGPLYRVIEKLLAGYEKTHGIIPLHHEMLVSLFSRLAALAVTLILILILGYLGRKFFFHSLMKATNKLIFKIPIVGALYRLTKDITSAVLTSDGKTFKSVALLPFPSKEMYTLGLVTGEVPAAIRQAVPSLNLTVFVPPAPHPVSGYVLFCPQEAIHTMPVSVEDTFKFILSCGVAHPPPS